jgi:hypothetical protein
VGDYRAEVARRCAAGVPRSGPSGRVRELARDDNDYDRRHDCKGGENPDERPDDARRVQDSENPDEKRSDKGDGDDPDQYVEDGFPCTHAVLLFRSCRLPALR